MNIQIVREPVFHIIIDDILPIEMNDAIYKHIVSLEKKYILSIHTHAICIYITTNTTVAGP